MTVRVEEHPCRGPGDVCIRIGALTASKRIGDWVTAFSLDTNLGQKLHYYNSALGATCRAIERAVRR